MNTNVYQEYKQIPRAKLTTNICNNYIKKDPRIVTVMPKELINNETVELIINNAPALLTKIPKELVTEDLINKAITNKPALLTYIPNSLLTERFCKNLAIDNPLIIRFMKPDVLTPGIVNISIYYYINSTTILQELFNAIPGTFLSKDILEKIIDNNIKASRVIPYHKLESETRDYIVNMILNKSKEYAEKYIPKKYLPNNEEKKIEKKRNIEDKTLELNILKELAIILTSGGSIEKIAKKYDISPAKITNIIEKQQEMNPEFYNALKSKLISNQTTWVINMETDYQILEKIISSLNIDNTTQLSREQKIKFAYLYNRLCKKLS